jgi:tetratricopeptide (TPR) repeat protein
LDDLLREFSALLDQRRGTGLAASIDLLLAAMGPERAEQLRLCSIPHEFDRQVLRVLAPGVDADAAYIALAGLSFVLPAAGDMLVLHDDARSYLFGQWLSQTRLPLLRALSARLVIHFEVFANAASDSSRDAADLYRIFHLLGADQSFGFEQFEDLLRQRRRQFRLTDCAALLKLVHEYDAVLTRDQSYRLKYEEARLSIDLRNFAAAETTLNELLKVSDLPLKVEIEALKSLASIHSEQHDFERARAELETALHIASPYPEFATLLSGVLHDRGCVYRDLGNTAEAEADLSRCLAIAERQGDLAMLALASNSLGTVWQRLGDSRRAIVMFNQSLRFLVQAGDVFRRAQVYNNLGMVYAELRDWVSSEQMLTQSLSIKRDAGDSKGQAIALSNLMRVYRNLPDITRATEVGRQAMALFTHIGDLPSAEQVNKNLTRLRDTGGEIIGRDEAQRRSLVDGLNRAEAAQHVRRSRQWWVLIVLLFFALWWIVAIAWREQ